MKVFRSGELIPNILEREIDIQALDGAKREVLKRLDFILATNGVMDQVNRQHM